VSQWDARPRNWVLVAFVVVAVIAAALLFGGGTV
jgi:uncharacterized membrane protein YtjA (UPF0391 family)